MNRKHIIRLRVGTFQATFTGRLTQNKQVVFDCEEYPTLSGGDAKSVLGMAKAIGAKPEFPSLLK